MFRGLRACKGLQYSLPARTHGPQHTAPRRPQPQAPHQGALSSGTPPASARHTHPSPRLDHKADSASIRWDRAQGEGHRLAAPETLDSPAVQPPAGRLPRGRGGPAPFLMFSLQSLSSDTSEPALTALLISKWTRNSPCLASAAQHLLMGNCRPRSSPKKVLTTATPQPCSFSKESNGPG